MTVGDDLICQCKEEDTQDLRETLSKLGDQCNKVRDKADKHKVPPPYTCLVQTTNIVKES